MTVPLRPLRLIATELSGHGWNDNNSVLFHSDLTSTVLDHLPFKHVYEVRPRKDKRGVDLISNADSNF